MILCRIVIITGLIFLSPLWCVSGKTPYDIDPALNKMLLGGTMGLSLSGMYFDWGRDSLSDETITSLNRSDVNAFDRSATYNYSSLLNNISYGTVAACMISPLFLTASPDVRSDASVLGLMYAETLLLSFYIPSFAKIIERPRPYVYNEDAPWDEKTDDRAGRSFFSAHTSLAFGSSVFLSTVFSDLYPASKWKPWVWTGSLFMASLTGYLRYESGYHFPSDVLTGAAVGSLIGFTIPLIYRSDLPAAVSLSTGSNSEKALLTCSFSY